MRRGSSFALTALLAVSAGCYDSRWGQGAETQRQHAASHAPTLRGERQAAEAKEGASSEAPPRARTMRVRAYVTRAYASQIVDVVKTLRDLLDDASDVTEPTLHVRFELEGTRPWDLGETDLAAALAALVKADAGPDVDWVVGLASGLPRATLSFHDLGMGGVPGRHLVLRAPSSAEKHDELDRLYRDLSEEERRRLQKEHRRHRAAAVFLHEIGHSLGAIHERSESSLMFPQYRPKMTSFGEGATTVMRVGLARRDAKTTEEQRTMAREIGGALRALPAAAIYEDERARFVKELDAFVSRTAQAAPPPDATPPVEATPAEPTDTGSMPAEDRERFARARELLAARDHVKAWETAKPLYARHPDVRSLQEFRCNLATSVFRFEVARKECDRLMAIDTR